MSARAVRGAKEYHSHVAVTPHPFTRADAFAVLVKADHGFLAETYVEAICVAFGVKPMLQRIKVDSRAFKGLNQAWDDDGKPLADGTYIFGADAASLAEHICVSLGVKYPPMFGRGSQLRAACGSLQAWMDRETNLQRRAILSGGKLTPGDVDAMDADNAVENGG